MIYENRVYTAVPGKLPAINARFADITIDYFNQYEIGMMGFWNDEIGTSKQLTYILTFDSVADREKKMDAVSADTSWQQVRAETEVDGPLVAQVQNLEQKCSNLRCIFLYCEHQCNSINLSPPYCPFQLTK